MNSFSKRVQKFRKNSFQTPKSIYLFGLFFALVITLKEVLNISDNNFQIFSFGSLDFWNDVNPYSDWSHLNKRGIPLDVFIYLPLFSILFTPFALLPSWLGAFCWNFFTYSLFYFSIFNLPDKYDFKNKKFIFFISCLLLFATILSMQFNPVVAAIFLLSYTLLEKKHSFWAILLICISGFTKVYGIFQLSMLIFYPKFWKNVLYTIGVSIVLFFAPLVRFNFTEMIDYYQSWIVSISDHSKMQIYYSIYRAVYSITPAINNFASKVSIVILFLIFAIGLYQQKRIRHSFVLRAQFLGILMSYTILFGLGSELHTYVIAMVGYAIWYIFIDKTSLDKVLLWINFFLLVIFPIDILCPVFISKFVLGKLHLGVIMFFITWCVMVYKSFYLSKTKAIEKKSDDL
ncbi:hypothetical protein LPB03_16070 [Polaribacter vadi]|uniref:DUF2029 domain-containing protein n=1 Tax=Polaribacter vadi TaxID=1774273 RepID=A0A1B8TP87_9FLAO|nr:glycosyltransferase family 87 protein [Polaribacter vadi]AOW18873.1 hypothetical protein LPB03_16070 [Polaribacter vadi]OBY61318.1 hypothetical protein LPB3_16015 [Polaribacter vadi]